MARGSSDLIDDPRRPTRHRLVTTALGIVTALSVTALAACGPDGVRAESVTIEGAWARASAAGQTTGAIYFELTVDRDDTLLGASVPRSVAADAQIHEAVPAAADAMDHDAMDHDAMDHDSGSGDVAMTMQEIVDGLSLTADTTVSFEPGSYHVMLLDIAAPLTVGDRFDLTLQFAGAGTIETVVEVSASAP